MTPSTETRWVCLGGGPSLTQADVDFCRGKAHILAVSDAFRLAPFADVLYSCDVRWWDWHAGAPTFTGRKFAMDARAKKWPDVTILENTGDTGLERKATGLRNGRNSGFQAINLAVHLGATRIVLLGYDMQPAKDGRDHWFGAHPNRVRPPFRLFLEHFPTIVQPLRALGVTVVNATRRTALRCFPQMPLEEALA